MIKIKRIIAGKTYNTETAAIIFEAWSEHSDAGVIVYQTRHGAFFAYEQDRDPSDWQLRPLTDAETQSLLEKWGATDALEQAFGTFPEAGAAETRLTIRIPGNLATRVENAAKLRGVSLNSYAMRCFERCVAEDGRPVGRE
jgi:hypothetical protein